MWIRYNRTLYNEKRRYVVNLLRRVVCIGFLNGGFMNRSSAVFLCFILFMTITSMLVPQHGISGEVLISEFLAVNRNYLEDEDGESSDWIELFNSTGSSIDLLNWSLTDDPENLGKWRFPDLSIQAGEFLIVFASGKNRRDPDSELHANFKIDGNGEYLALVRPDGVTIEQQFTPEFPRQHPDISYGTGQTVTASTFVSEETACRFIVPENGNDGLSWTDPVYNDSSWSDGINTLGYDTEEGIDPGQLETYNIASIGTAAQSTTCYSRPADLAIDGTYNTFTHTCSDDPDPTWELDLKKSCFIESITLHNRSGYYSRLRDITISILDVSGVETVFRSALLNPENAGYSYPDGPETLSVDLVDLTGSLVRGGIIRIVRTPDPDLSGSDGQGNQDESTALTLVEVEVIGAGADQPLGYNGIIKTDIKDVMLDVNSSLYIRFPFSVDDPSIYEYLKLRVKYDDGFTAYLNGRQIAGENSPATPFWNSQSVEGHPDDEAIHFETFDVSQYLSFLENGENVLAIHALNVAASDEDFLLSAELEGNSFLQQQATFLNPPTPREPNDSQAIMGFVTDTTFSHDRGFYEEPFSVHISCGTEGAKIRYTLNGNAPTPSYGTIYVEGDPLYIDRTTTLRAIAYHEDPGIEPSNVDTQTYIFLADVIEQDYNATRDAGFPSSWGGTSPDYGMDFDVIGQNGTDGYGGKYAATIKEDLTAVPTVSIVMNIDDMFGSNGIYTNSTQRGVAWERPVSAELIYPNGDQGFQENCGLRIQGGAFRNHSLTKKHSLRLLFKDDYGDTKLRYPLFGPNAADRFDTITLRSNSNDGWQWAAAGDKPLFIRDSFGRGVMLLMNQPTSHETFVHLYINGIYWGLYNPVERPDDSFGATYCGGEKETWDSISHNGVKNGSWSAWNTMIDLAYQCSTSNPAEAVATFFKIQGRNPDGTDNPDWAHYMDVVNFADYMITNLYVGNTDWPHKNFWMGRDQSELSTGFKFYMWDSEWSLGLRSDLNTNRVGVGGDDIAEAWPYMKQNAEFRLLVADRLHHFFFNGGPLYVDSSEPGWDPSHPERNRPAALFMRLADTVDRAVVAESARWGDQHESTPYTRDEHWEIERDNLIDNYFPGRSEIVLQQFRSAGLYPSINAPIFNRHGGRIEEGFVLTMHTQLGTIYYTLDGTDPRLPGGGISSAAHESAQASETVLVPEEAALSCMVPSDGSLGLAWTEEEFDDSSWKTGRSGVGYERSPEDTTNYTDLISTDVEEEMYAEATTVYIRIPFEIDDASRFSSLTLHMKYDDGFAAYLNGTLLPTRNCPDAPQWDSSADGNHSDSQAVVYENISIFDTQILKNGRNVLAIHGLNVNASSSDFIIMPQLTASEIAEGEGVTLNGTTHVCARCFVDGTWSALNEAVFRVPSPIEALKITEIMYNPPDNGLVDGDEYEFLELQNTGTETLDLSAVSLSEGIEFTFAEGSILDPGDYLLLVRNLDLFREKYPHVNPAVIRGSYSLKLSNKGDRIILTDGAQDIVSITAYDDFSAWPKESDGFGYSLVPVDVQSETDPATYSYWRASTNVGGSPGGKDPGSGPEGGWQRPGDINQDSVLDISDAISYLLYLFSDREIQLPCDETPENDNSNIQLLDVNGDMGLNISDVVYILSYLFNQGAQPVLGENCIRIQGCPDVCVD